VRIQSARSGRFDPGQFLDGGGVTIFVEIRLGHTDAADDGEALDKSAPLHQLLKTPVQITNMDFAFHHFVTAHGELHRHIAGNAGWLGPCHSFRYLPEAEIDVERGRRVLRGRVLGAVGCE